MNKFRICPCCFKFHLYKRYTCEKCSFVIYENKPGEIPHYYSYMFKTNKYLIYVNSDISMIYTMDDAANIDYNNFWRFNKKLSPRTKDIDIEKLLVLL